MLFLKGNSQSTVEACREAPDIGAPFVVSDKKSPSPFYKNDSSMNGIVEGYDSGPQNSYAEELVNKYPLNNE